MDEQKLLDMVLQLRETSDRRERTLKYGRYVSLKLILNGPSSTRADLQHVGGATLKLRLARGTDDEWHLTQVRAKTLILSNRNRRFLNNYLPWGWHIARRNFIWYMENAALELQSPIMFRSNARITRNEYVGGLRPPFHSPTRYRTIKRGTDALLEQISNMYDVYVATGLLLTLLPIPLGQCANCKKITHAADCDQYQLWEELRNRLFSPGVVIHPATNLLSEEDSINVLDTLEAIWFDADLPMLEKEPVMELLGKIIPPYIRRVMGYAI